METVGAHPLEEGFFLGRPAELGRLREGFARAQAGRAQVCLVGGASGIGKTALIRRFLATAPAGDPVDRPVLALQARCYERQTAPFKPVGALLQDLVRRLEAMGADRPDLEPPPELVQMFPALSVLGSGQQGGRSPRPAEPLALRERAFQGLRRLFTTLQEHAAVILFIDDLHWADEDTLVLLLQLVSASDAPAVLLLASYRAEALEESRAFLELLARCDGDDGLRLMLDPLPADDVGELARALLKREVSPDAAVWTTLVSRIVQESEGSPLLVEELVRYLRRRLASPAAGRGAMDSTRLGSLELSEVLHARIAELPERVRRVLDVVAVAGDPVPLAVVVDTLEGDSAPSEWMTRLRSECLVRQSGRTDLDDVDTFHDRIRESVIDHLPEDRRVSIHGSLAEAMQRFDPERVDFLAKHWQAAGEPAKALRYLVEVAQRAARQLAFERAAELFRQAVSLEEDPVARSGLQESLGEALANLGRLQRAAEAYLAAADDAEEERRLPLRLRAGEQLLRGGHMARGFEVLGRVLREIGFPLTRSPNRAVISILRNRAWLFFRGLRFRKRLDTPLTVLDALYAASTYIAVVDTVHGADLQNRYLRRAASSRDEGHYGMALAVEGTHQATQGAKHFDRARELNAQAAPLLAKMTDARRAAMIHLGAGMTEYFAGQWQAAHDKLARAEAAFLEQGLDVHWELATTRMWYCFALIQLGEFPELLRRYDDHVEEAIRFGNHYAAGSMRTRLNVVWAIRGDVARAEEDLSHLLDTYPTGSYQVQHFWSLHGRCDGLLYRGRGAEALEQLQRDWRLIKRAQLHRVHLVRAEVQSLMGRAALSAAARAPDDPARQVFLKAAQRAAKALRREGAGFAKVWGAMVEAGIVQQTQGLEAAVAAVDHALAMAGTEACPLHEVALRCVRGELLDTDESREEAEIALAWLKERGVVDPRRFVELVATGLGRWPKGGDS